MKKNITGPVLIVLCVFSVFFSCTKIDTTNLGNELIPAVDNVNTFETVLDIITNNVLLPQDTTQMPYNLDHAIGIIENDPDFGKTEAALYFDVAPATLKSYPFVNKDSIVAVDSIILSLAYKSLYGDSNAVQKFEVFEVDQSADFKYSDDSDYPIQRPDFPVVATPIGTRTFDFKILNDSVFYINATDTIRTVNELRIPINTSFATRFINGDTTNVYNNDSIFKTYLKGLAVKSSNTTSGSNNALGYFDLADAKTKITFYCRVKQGGTTTSIAPFFSYNNIIGTAASTIGAQANIIKRAPSNGFLSNVTNTSPNDQVLYLQSTPGSYATLKIPGIDTLTNRIIHRAEISIEKINAVSEVFGVPDLLYLDILRNDSLLTIERDFIQTGTNSYDVNLFGGKLKDNRYLFNISRYIQNIVTNKRPNDTLRLYAPFIARPFVLQPSGYVRVPFLINPRVAAGRVIVAGGNHPSRKMQLRIIYSKI